MPHPNSATDPDCTSRDALTAALEIKIAAETYAELLLHLKRQGEEYECSMGQLLGEIDEIHQRVTEKYLPLRAIIKEIEHAS